MSLCISHLPHPSQACGLTLIDQDLGALGESKGPMRDANRLLNSKNGGQTQGQAVLTTCAWGFPKSGAPPVLSHGPIPAGTRS